MPSYTPTAYEQYSLELLNRARLNPLGEVAALISDMATRTGVTPDITAQLTMLNVDLGLFRSQMAAFDRVAPLAWNVALGQAAEKHSALLARNDSQSHQEPGEPGLADRIRAEGYVPWRWSENVFSYGKDPVFTHAAFVIDWGYGPGGMQTPAGHRNVILDGRVKEVGIGAVTDAQIGPWVVTQDFAYSGPDYRAQLVGVVIDDRDGDDFYDIGEGMGGVTVTVTGAGGSYSTTTWAAGGYQLALAAGTYEVVFSGGGLNGTVTKQVRFGGTDNVKLDAEAAEAVLLPVLPEGYIGGTRAGETLVGSAGGDALYAGGGADLVLGRGGDDLVSGEAYDAGFDAAAAQIYRLYAATLGRAPDQAGHRGWTDLLVDGRIGLEALAARFVSSPEFQSRFTADRATDFVDLLYENVLGRAPDAAGRAWWAERIDSGAASRAEVVLGFAESDEHVARTLPGSLGFSRAGSQADFADDVYRLYGATLGRAPDAAGLEGWAGALAEGQSYLRVIEGFVGSAEFASRFGAVPVAGAAGGSAVSAQAFVDLLYGNVLGRDGDAGGRAYWTGQIASGAADAARVVASFAQGTEFVARTASAFEAWAAGMGGDRLGGGTGDNVLFGGIGADTFVIARADGGTQTVADLSAYDLIQMTGFGYRSGAEALTHVTADASGEAVFADQGVQIRFTGLTPAEIGADQFLF